MLTSINSLMLFSSDVIDEFDNNKLVVIHIPRTDNSSSWLNLLCDAVHSRSAGTYEYRSQHTWDGIEDFKSYLIRLFPDNYGTDWNDMLEGGAHTSPTFIVINSDCVGDLNADAFFQLVHTYQSWDRSLYNRKIVIVLHGVLAIPGWVNGPGVRYFQLWNALAWEEMRTLANQLVQKNDNHYFRSWQIATYSGSANLDPFVLNEITLNAPDNLYEVYAFVRNNFENHTSNSTEIISKNSDSTKWKVPKEFERFWLSGDVLGTSIERGINISWSRVIPVDRERMVVQSIWREQMTTLFPMIAEVGDLVAEKITDNIGSDDWKDIANQHDYGYFTEPGVIIKLFSDRNNGLPYIETALWDLLHVLKDMRNQLAHRNCLDSSNMRTLWSKVSILN